MKFFQVTFVKLFLYFRQEIAIVENKLRGSYTNLDSTKIIQIIKFNYRLDLCVVREIIRLI